LKEVTLFSREWKEQSLSRNDQGFGGVSFCMQWAGWLRKIETTVPNWEGVMMRLLICSETSAAPFFIDRL
jgi:hypothetical protein